MRGSRVRARTRALYAVRVFTEETGVFNALDLNSAGAAVGRVVGAVSLPDASLHVLSRGPFNLRSFSGVADVYSGSVEALPTIRRRCDVDLRTALLPWHMGGLADPRKGHAAGWRGSVMIDDRSVVVGSRSRTCEVAVFLPTVGVCASLPGCVFLRARTARGAPALTVCFADVLLFVKPFSKDARFVRVEKHPLHPETSGVRGLFAKGDAVSRYRPGDTRATVFETTGAGDAEGDYVLCDHGELVLLWRRNGTVVDFLSDSSSWRCVLPRGIGLSNLQPLTRDTWMLSDQWGDPLWLHVSSAPWVGGGGAPRVTLVPVARGPGSNGSAPVVDTTSARVFAPGVVPEAAQSALLGAGTAAGASARTQFELYVTPSSVVEPGSAVAVSGCVRESSAGVLHVAAVGDRALVVVRAPDAAGTSTLDVVDLTDMTVRALVLAEHGPVVAVAVLPTREVAAVHEDGLVRVLEVSPAALASSLGVWKKLVGAADDTPLTLELRREPDGESKSPPPLEAPKRGKEDEENKPHVGGSTWAGWSRASCA